MVPLLLWPSLRSLRRRKSLSDQTVLRFTVTITIPGTNGSGNDNIAIPGTIGSSGRGNDNGKRGGKDSTSVTAIIRTSAKHRTVAFVVYCQRKFRAFRRSDPVPIAGPQTRASVASREAVLGLPSRNCTPRRGVADAFRASSAAKMSKRQGCEQRSRAASELPAQVPAGPDGIEAFLWRDF